MWGDNAAQKHIQRKCVIGGDLIDHNAIIFKTKTLGEGVGIGCVRREPACGRRQGWGVRDYRNVMR
jgi:hypothetical protein